MSDPNFTPDSNRRQPGPPPFLSGTAAENRSALGTCPTATTLTARVAGTADQVLFAITCKRWTCPTCAARKTKRLAYLVKDAEPNRLLTLTVDPSKWTDQEAAYVGTKRQIAPLVTRLRRRFGDIEYFRVTEVTKKGWPHYHLLVRSSFLPQPVVKATWHDLTGATIVDLRQVKQTWEAYRYVTKYLAKLHVLPWTTRHLSWSKGFFSRETDKHGLPYSLAEKKLYALHPAEFLSEFCQGWTVRQEGACIWKISQGKD